MNIKQKIESLLFVAGKPLNLKKIIELLEKEASKKEVVEAVDELINEYKSQNKGIQLIRQGDKVQMATSADASDIVQRFIKDETTGELSKPSIETLTIVAYRGPVSKLELERIRGINCSLILRNLLLRGLITENYDKRKQEDYYEISLDFLRHLGISQVNELPDYNKLHSNKDIDKFLEG